jgi:hypothetical protein
MGIGSMYSGVSIITGKPQRRGGGKNTTYKRTPNNKRTSNNKRTKSLNKINKKLNNTLSSVNTSNKMVKKDKMKKNSIDCVFVPLGKLLPMFEEYNNVIVDNEVNYMKADDEKKLRDASEAADKYFSKQDVSTASLKKPSKPVS